MADKSPNGNANPKNPPHRKLFITNFPTHFKEQDLQKAFSDFGDIENCYIVPEKKFAFIQFVDIEDAKKAKAAMCGAAPLRLVVEYAKERMQYSNTKQQQNKTRNGSTNTNMKQVCVKCGDLAKYKCGSCSTKYCSAKCGDEDWPSHVFKCMKPPTFIPFLTTSTPSMNSPNESIDDGKSSSSASNSDISSISGIECTKNITSPPNVLDTNKGMQKALFETLRDIQANLSNGNKAVDKDKDIKAEKIATDKDIKAEKNATDKDKDIKAEKNATDSPMQNLIMKLKKANIKKTWEAFKPLPPNKFSQVRVQFVQNNKFAGYLFENEAIAMDMLSKANDENTILEPLHDLKTGELVIACEDNLRWRSKVLSISPCTVCLLDSGLIKTVNKDELFKAPSILENVPAQGILMQFAPGQNYAVQQYDILSVKPTGEVVDGAQIVNLE